MRLGEVLAALADRTPTPGGGAAAGMMLAISAALGEMVLAYTIGKPKFAEHDATQRSQRGRLAELRGSFLRLADEDAAAYGLLSATRRLPSGDPGRTALVERYVAAALPPLQMAEESVELCRILDALVGTTNTQLLSDLEIARDLAGCGHRAATRNVWANVGEIPAGEARAPLEHRLARLQPACQSS